MPQKVTPIPERERRVTKLSLYIGVMGGLLALLGAVALSYGQRQASLGFIGGFGQGILLTLPFFFAILMIKALQTMDEYARQQQILAAAVAFLVTMLVSGVLLSLEPLYKFHTPAWVYYGVGMLTWGLAAAFLALRDRRAVRQGE